MKGCDLCSGVARVHCESDDASLCFDCDAKVHGANFLVARHQRALLCRACHTETPWKASGTRVGPAVSVCVACVQERSSFHGNKDGDQEGESARNQDEDGDNEDEDEDDDEDEDEDDCEEEEEEEGEEQVVPLAVEVEEDEAAPPPPLASSSSSEEEEKEEEEEVKPMARGFRKRMKGNALDLPPSSDHFSNQPRLLPPVRTGVVDDEAILYSFRPLKIRKRNDMQCGSNKYYQLF